MPAVPSSSACEPSARTRMICNPVEKSPGATLTMMIGIVWSPTVTIARPSGRLSGTTKLICVGDAKVTFAIRGVPPSSATVTVGAAGKSAPKIVADCSGANPVDVKLAALTTVAQTIGPEVLGAKEPSPEYTATIFPAAATEVVALPPVNGRLAIIALLPAFINCTVPVGTAGNPEAAATTVAVIACVVPVKTVAVAARLMIAVTDADLTEYQLPSPPNKAKIWCGPTLRFGMFRVMLPEESEAESGAEPIGVEPSKISICPDGAATPSSGSQLICAEKLTGWPNSAAAGASVSARAGVARFTICPKRAETSE